jgi:hypothetical protein
MGFANYIWQWEGDETQAIGNMFWKSKEFLYPKKIRFAACRIIFITGDLDDYQALVDERNAIISRNLEKLSTGQIGTIGGNEGGYLHALYPIAGDNLEDVPLEPTYAGELELTFKLYTNDVLRHTKILYTTEIFKLPGGYRGRRHYFTLEGNVERIKRVDLSTSIWELKHDQSEFGG